jgi:hypothetical protein
MRTEISLAGVCLRQAKPVVSIACGLGLVILASACSSNSTHTSAHKVGNKDILLTSADLRATIVSNDPQRGSVVCAEPSPDLAKAVQSSFGAGGSVSADIPTQVSASVAASIARSRAEAAAQLGERLATIQLLRDGLYRVCEAYANGAIDEVYYALLLGRYDDTMVTMLAGELAAGNFGRQLATLGGNSTTAASAQADLNRTLAMVHDAAQEVEDATQQVEAADRELDQAEATLAAAEARGDDTTDEAAAVEEKKQAAQERQNNLVLAAKNAANAAATASATAGGITPSANQDIASVEHEIQATYINDKDFDSLMIACLTALTNPKYERLANLCDDRSGSPGLLQRAVHLQMAEEANPAITNVQGPSRATDATLIMAGQ